MTPGDRRSAGGMKKNATTTSFDADPYDERNWTPFCWGFSATSTCDAPVPCDIPGCLNEIENHDGPFFFESEPETYRTLTL